METDWRLQKPLLSWKVISTERPLQFFSRERGVSFVSSRSYNSSLLHALSLSKVLSLSHRMAVYDLILSHEGWFKPRVTSMVESVKKTKKNLSSYHHNYCCCCDVFKFERNDEKKKKKK
mmetsp:Transcript_51214/g.57225  ORF Transcript_51214/g.57225 Transcript_51214/m.57225 type:complete len:119 (-) Transcript_51214:1115-1471(-)